MFFIKIKSRVEGTHVKARIFMGENKGAPGFLGTLVFREEEYGLFCEALYLGAGFQDDVDLEIEARGENDG